MASKELNILVLGETGVGKSTWINSLLNYISFSTLDEAMKEKRLHQLIASSFVVTTTIGKKLMQREIKVGESANEDNVIGNSATQCSTPYVIRLEGCTIRLIDTPGIGDTRGTDQDQKNMEDILTTINHYDVLHGIVILLKPNDSRIGVMFRFVVQELLTHLHRSAAQNIVFGFTNTRQTHYQPGDTLPSLHKLLTKMAADLIELTTDTVYNFDSESFRFLAAHKQGVDLGYKKDYEKSWERSVDECIRMLSYIAALPPHPITNTVTLNSSRKLITDLTKPMAEISRLITLNIQMNEEEANILQETKASGAELLKKLKVKRIDLSQVSLSQPVTVCTNSNYIKVRSCDNDARLAYLDHLIKQEENKLHASRAVGNNVHDEDMRKRTQEVITALELSRSQYNYREVSTKIESTKKKINQNSKHLLLAFSTTILVVFLLKNNFFGQFGRLKATKMNDFVERMLRK